MNSHCHNPCDNHFDNVTVAYFDEQRLVQRHDGEAADAHELHGGARVVAVVGLGDGAAREPGGGGVGVKRETAFRLQAAGGGGEGGGGS